MVIYVEYVVIDNMVINSLILLLTKDLLKLKNRKVCIFLSALFGTVISLLSPIITSTVNLLLKPLVAIVMVMIAFWPKKLKKLIITLLTFLLITFCFGGAVLGVMSFFNISVTYGSTIMYEYNFPVGVVVLIVLITYIALKSIAKYLYQKKTNNNYIYQVILKNNNNSVTATAFLDTGNKLTFEQKPVSIINYKTFNKLFPYIDITDVLLKRQINLKNQNYIEIQSIGEKQKLLCFEVESLTLNNKEIKNVTLALSLTNFSQKTQSDIIISNKLLEDMLWNLIN